MVRSRWIKTVMATLVSSGLALGQQAVPTSPPKEDPTGRIITVTENGKPPHKCRVVKWWNDAKGQRNLQVESLVNGEVMTIVETGMPVVGMSTTAPAPRQVQTTIFHWGKDGRPPAGTPLPPATVVTVPSPLNTKAIPIVTKVESTSSKPTITRVETPTPKHPVIVVNEAPQPAQPQTRAGFYGGRPNRNSTPSSTTVIETGPDGKKQVVTVVEPAKGSDWRQSWGKTDGKTSTDLKKIADAGKASTEPRKLSGDFKPTADGKGTTGDVKPASTSNTEVKKPDPLDDPGRFARLPTDLKPTVKTETSKRTDLPAVAATVPAAPTAGDIQPASGLKRPALGSRSVVDSGSSQYIPLPVVTMPNTPPPRPAWQVPQPPQITPQMANAPECDPTRPVVNAFTPTEKMPAPPYSAMASMTSNAFSSNHHLAPNVPPPTMPMAGVFGPSAPPVGPHGYAANPAVPSVAPYGPAVQMAMKPVASTGVAPVGYATAAPNAAVSAWPAANASPQQLMMTLRDSLYPSQRKYAVERMAMLDWKTHEAVVGALMVAAKEDPAPTVRAACVRALGRMKVNTVPVVTMVQSLRTDSDVRVRQEVEEALTTLAPGSAAAAPSRSSAPAVMPAIPATTTPSTLPTLPALGGSK